MQVTGFVPSPLIAGSWSAEAICFLHTDLHILPSAFTSSAWRWGNCYPSIANEESDAWETVTLQSSMSHIERARTRTLLSLAPPGSRTRPQTSAGPAPPECIVEWTTPPSSVVFGLCFFKYWGFEALLQPRPSASACLTYWCPSDLSLRKAAAENCFKRQLSPKVLTTPKALLSRGQCQFFEKSLKLI